MSHWTRRYFGKPWVNGARGPDAYDCWGLVRSVYLDRYGLDLPIVPVDALQPMAVRHAIAGFDLSDWDGVLPSALQEGDVVELSQATKPHHIGVWVAADGGLLLHALEGIGVILTGRASLRLNGWHITDAYRHRRLGGA